MSDKDYLVHKLFPSGLCLESEKEEGHLTAAHCQFKKGQFRFEPDKLTAKCVLLLMQTPQPAVIHMQRVSVSDPVYSNVNPLVCLTFQ